MAPRRHLLPSPDQPRLRDPLRAERGDDLDQRPMLRVFEEEPEPPLWQRRKVLAAGAGFLAAVAGIAWLATRPEQDPSIVAIGRAYLQQVPAENDRATLERLLRQSGAEGDEILSGTHPLVAEDFRLQRTVVLDGWLLARSEGRAAALVALEA